MFMQDHSRFLTGVLVEKQITFDDSLNLIHIPNLIQYVDPSEKSDLKESFDQENQSSWFIPEEYASFDIVTWVLDQCKTAEEEKRASDELLMYGEREMIPHLQYLKYLVDTMRKNNILWGVGRGSSVASYVLFLIGIHRIDSLKFNLEINEFLK